MVFVENEKDKEMLLGQVKEEFSITENREDLEESMLALVGQLADRLIAKHIYLRHEISKNLELEKKLDQADEFRAALKAFLGK